MVAAIESLRVVGVKEDVVVLIPQRLMSRRRLIMQALAGLDVLVLCSPLFRIRTTDPFVETYMTPYWAAALTCYEMVAMFRPNVRFTANPSTVFLTSSSSHDMTAASSAHSPINGDFIVLRPSKQLLADLVDLPGAYGSEFTAANGWLNHGPIPDWRDASLTTAWAFPRAQYDQGFLYWYFFCFRGEHSARLVDPRAWAEFLAVE